VILLPFDVNLLVGEGEEVKRVMELLMIESRGIVWETCVEELGERK
jgi:hypothetical protein